MLTRFLIVLGLALLSNMSAQTAAAMDQLAQAAPADEPPSKPAYQSSGLRATSVIGVAGVKLFLLASSHSRESLASVRGRCMTAA